MRISHDHDFAVGRLEYRRGCKLARFVCKIDAKVREGRIGHQLATPSLAEAFETALLTDSIVTFLVTVAALRDHVAVALRERIALRDNGSIAVDEDFAAQLRHCRDNLVSDRVAETANLARCVERNFL